MRLFHRGSECTRAANNGQLNRRAIELDRELGARLRPQREVTIAREDHQADALPRRNDLIVWPLSDFSVEAIYDLSADGAIVPRFTTPTNDVRLPTLTSEQILFRGAPVEREGWIKLWETQSADATLPGVRVIPETSSAASAIAPASS